MNILRSIVFVPVAAALVCLGGTGMAQDREGYYASVSGLFVLPRDSELSVPAGGETAAADIKMKSGFGFLAAFGYSLTSELRAELELGYRGYDFDRLTKSQGGPVDGELNTVSLMANGIYSFDVGGFRPYAGLGVGLATHEPKFEEIAFRDGVNTVRVRVVQEGSTKAFAYQVIAGVGYPLSDRSEILLGYRYFGSTNADLGSGIEMSHANHNFEVGLLYSF